ncbi:MAG: DUF3800 domain-containing protein [bacterium]
MSYLLFLDESGHDHRTMPYEVRGGVALHASKLWSFIRAVAALEQDCFGDRLYRYKTEIKGCKLLDKDRFKWSAQMPPLDALTRRENTIAFLRKGLSKNSIPPTRIEFAAYGQSCLAMAHGIFALLKQYEGKIFACAIPKNVGKLTTEWAEENLRKDHVFLFERFYYFLNDVQQTGLLVMDETENNNDRQFVRQLERYFTLTAPGQLRSQWIVPAPFFVESDMAYPVQVADVCIYCINWGFRCDQAMNGGVRPEIADRFGEMLLSLQWKGDVHKGEKTFTNYGICYVPDPNESRQQKRR